MAERAYLVIDCGASNGRAVLARYDGRRFALEVTHRFENRPVTVAGTLSWDVLRLFSEIEIGLQKAARDAPELSSMGVDTWGVDFGMLDARGRLIANPVHYRDQRRNSAEHEVYALVPREEVFRLSGALILSIMSLFSLYVMRRDGDPELAVGRRFLMMPDLLHYFLTGVESNEFSDACTTAVFNQADRRWEERILDRLGIPRGIFAPTALPGTRIGALSAALQSELGVGPVEVIAPATHDTASAVAGIPARVSDPAWAFVSIGTWGVVGRETGKPILERAVLDTGWGNEGGPDGRCFLAANVAGLWPAQQCRRRWIVERGTNISWEEIVRASLAAPALRTIIDIDDPGFSPVHPDMPAVLAAYCRSHALPVPQGMGAMARCLFESLALKFRHRLEELERLTGGRVALVRMVGGGTQNETLCQWTADASGIPVEAGPVETTVAGNLLMQLRGTGEIESVAQGREIVAASCESRRYEPGGKAPWDEAYARLLDLLARPA